MYVFYDIAYAKQTAQQVYNPLYWCRLSQYFFCVWSSLLLSTAPAAENRNGMHNHAKDAKTIHFLCTQAPSSYQYWSVHNKGSGNSLNYCCARGFVLKS